jgi:hypothetical protein
MTLGICEGRQSASAVRLQFRSRDIGLRHNGRVDLLAVDAIRNRKGRRQSHGGVADQDSIDRRGRYLLTATIDQFLDSTGRKHGECPRPMPRRRRRQHVDISGDTLADVTGRGLERARFLLPKTLFRQQGLQLSGVA